MRHTIAAGLIVAATVVAGAQSSSRPTDGASPRAKPIMITGCLEAGSDQNTFTLTTAEADLKSRPAGSSGAAGSSGGAAPKPEVKTVVYMLTPAPGVNLKNHVGRTVQVTGIESRAETIAKTTENSKSTTTTSGTGEQPRPTVQTAAKVEIIARQLYVGSARSVRSDCRVQK